MKRLGKCSTFFHRYVLKLSIVSTVSERITLCHQFFRYKHDLFDLVFGVKCQDDLRKKKKHSSSNFNSDCLVCPPLSLNLYFSCMEAISLAISFRLQGLWRRLFSACANDLYLVLRCVKAELVEEEDGFVGVLCVFWMLLVRVLQGLSGWARCLLLGLVVGCWLSGLVFSSVFCTFK